MKLPTPPVYPWEICLVSIHDYQSTNVGSTDYNLISNVQKDSSEDWKLLVFQYTPLVYQWCKRAGFGPEDSSDITQNVFVSVYQSIHRFKKIHKSYSFRSWLWKITRHRICDHMKSISDLPRAVGGTGMNQLLKEYPMSPLPESDTSSHDSLKSLFLIAMANVSCQVNEQSWQAFEFLSLDSLSHKEVAEKLGMSEAAVRMVKSRIMKRLREEMDRLMRDSD